MKARFLLLFLFVIINNCFSQKLSESRRSSYYTYIYKLTNKQAKKIYLNNQLSSYTEDLKNPIDSFPTDSIYKKDLLPGHYIMVKLKEEKLIADLTTVKNCYAYIIDNNTNLCLQIFGMDGSIIDNAKVFAGSRKLKYDKKTKTYYLKKYSRKDNDLMITYQGLLQIEKINQNNSLYNSLRYPLLNFLNRKPIKYLWRPVNFVIQIPIDIGRMCIGSYYNLHTVRTIRNIRYKMYDLHLRNSYSGYCVLNKPKYKPDDTLKVKLFVKKNKSKLYNKPILFSLYTNKVFFEDTIKPYAPGGFSYDLKLNSDLKLSLDNTYTITFKKMNGKKDIDEISFKYEQYELKKNNFNLSSPNEHYRNIPFTVSMNGTDENGLIVPDAQAEVMILRKDVIAFYEKHCYVPDTLWKHSLNLKPSGNTELIIPDSIFGSVSMSYNIIARFRTSENEVSEKTCNVTYYFKKHDIDVKVNNGNLDFEYKRNNIKSTLKAELVYKSINDNIIEKRKVTFPLSIPLQTNISSVEILSDSLNKKIDIEDINSGLDCYINQNKDSFDIEVNNPNKLTFTYFIYNKNKLYKKGLDTQLSMSIKKHPTNKYYLMVQYYWAGKMVDKKYELDYNRNAIDLTVDQPSLIYPGGTTDINITVKDKKGKPIKNMDVTAYALTTKFNSTAPIVPGYALYGKNQHYKNPIRLNKRGKTQLNALKIAGTDWINKSNMDTCEYYRFLFPGNKIYQNHWQTNDNSTQFSVFLMKEGIIQPIHIIYVDHLPIFTSWASQNEPFSFHISPDLHNISIRTLDKFYNLGMINFESNHKKVLSFDIDSVHHINMLTINRPTSLNYNEIQIVKNTFQYRNTEDAYITNNNRVFLLDRSGKAGPLTTSAITYFEHDNYERTFQFEPEFEYEMTKEYMKMRERKIEYYDFKRMESLVKTNINDKARTREEVLKIIESKKLENQERIAIESYNHFYNHDKRNLLKINFSDSIFKNYQYIILLEKNALFLNIHQMQYGFEKYLNNDDKYYLFLYSRNDLQLSNPVLLSIKNDGLNYYEFDSLGFWNKHTEYNYSLNKFDSLLFNTNYSLYSKRKDIKKVLLSFVKSDTSNIADEIEENVSSVIKINNSNITAKFNIKYNYSNTIIGTVKEKSGEPIIGATIIEKGSKPLRETVSDIDGYFELTLSDPNSTIEIKMMGLKTQKFNAGNNNVFHIIMEADAVELESVVAIGYGSYPKDNVTGSFSDVDYERIPVRRIETALQGRAPGVMVQGTSSKVYLRGGVGSINSGSEPLYVVDGIIVENGDISMLKSEDIQNINILKDSEATSIYGSRAANGVVIITTKGGKYHSNPILSNDNNIENDFINNYTSSSTMRTHFSDYAYWQPQLRTNNEGKATFKVTFPDDVTNWKTYVIAIDNKRHSSIATGNIKSYKPLMAQLFVPHFLTKGDSINIIGKTLNYTKDSLNLKTAFIVENDTINRNSIYHNQSFVDTLKYAFTNNFQKDSLTIQYLCVKNDGYYDGEKRGIQVNNYGVEESNGSFMTLDSDTIISMDADSSVWNIVFDVDNINIILDEIKHVRNYGHFCNEQLASKLKSLLTEKKIKESLKQNFQYDSHIKDIINRLEKSQRNDGLWGWWKDGEVSWWISQHIAEALLMAKDMGYTIPVNFDNLIKRIVFEMEGDTNHFSLLRKTRLLLQMNAQVDYKKYIHRIDTINKSRINKNINPTNTYRQYGEKYNEFSFLEHLQLLELKHKCGFAVDMDTLNKTRKTTIKGNYYWSSYNQSNYYQVDNNNTITTIQAYKILKNVGATDEVLSKIRHYFLELRNSGHWLNTYESAEIISIIAPDLLNQDSVIVKPSIHLRGIIDEEIKTFPYTKTLTLNNALNIQKNSKYPVYFTAYKKSWNNQPLNIKDKNFEIVTSIGKNSSQLSSYAMEAGKPYSYEVSVHVKKYCDYVLLEIPIPAGCIYESKPQKNSCEIHREYYYDKVNVYYEKLNPGVYSVSIPLLAKFNGSFILNPARAEMMYEPLYYGHNTIKKIEIKK